MRKPAEPWKPPSWLEPAFIYIAFTVAVVAAAALLLWVLVTFVIPFNLYSRESEEIDLSNGQKLQVNYPNLLLVADTPAYITLVLSGESTATEPAIFAVAISPGLTVVEPVAQAQSKNVKLTAPNLGSATEPIQMKIGVINSRSVDGILLFVRRDVVIESSTLPLSQSLGIGIETISWRSAREIVNNTINEKSTLILLVTGFLSGAGTLVLQHLKIHRDRLREDRQKKEERFYKFLQQDSEGALNVFLRNGNGVQSEDSEDFITYKALVKQSNWYGQLLVNILLKLEKKEVFVARQIAIKLRELCVIFDIHGEDELLVQSLYELCDLALISYRRQDKKLLVEDAHSLLTVYIRWQKELSSIVIDLIQYYSSSPENLILLHEVFKKDGIGKTLLENSNLQHVTARWRVEDLSELDEKVLEVVYSLRWRSLWPRKERRVSERVQRWLSGHWYETGGIDDNISLGSQFAELDSNLGNIAIPHPVFEQVNGPFPVVVFGDEGMGKTAAALWLSFENRKQVITEGRNSEAFPVYAPLVAGVDVRKWIVEKMSLALIDFAADNPRRFLNASDSQKAAMGRLMLRYRQSMEALRLDFYSSPFDNSAGDLEEVLDYLSDIRYTPGEELTNDEMLLLLYGACPDTFDQVYFLWDIRGSANEDDTVRMISDVEELVLPLARQNFYLKIFAPLTVANKLNEIPGFRYPKRVLVWDESLLRKLIEIRIKMFDALWERGIDDPAGMLIATAGYSPRRVIQLLIALFDYVDKYLQEGEKLTRAIFDEVAFQLQGTSWNLS